MLTLPNCPFDDHHNQCSTNDKEVKPREETQKHRLCVYISKWCFSNLKSVSCHLTNISFFKKFLLLWMCLGTTEFHSEFLGKIEHKCTYTPHDSNEHFIFSCNTCVDTYVLTRSKDEERIALGQRHTALSGFPAWMPPRKTSLLHRYQTQW